MAVPSVAERNTSVVITIDNCTGNEMRLDFGDCNVINTSLCAIEHIYNTTGLLEVVLQVQNHSITRHLINVQDPVKGFEVTEISRSIILGEELFINWKLDLGTVVRITVDFGDNTTYNVALAEVSGMFDGNNSHTYKSPGVFSVVISAMNEAKQRHGGSKCQCGNPNQCFLFSHTESWSFSFNLPERSAKHNSTDIEWFKCGVVVHYG